MKVSLPILCYDNRCILCSRLMQWFIRHEQSNQLLFTPIGSELFQSITLKEDVDSIQLIKTTGIYQKSNAILLLIRLLKKPYCYLTLFRIIPYRLLDMLYDAVAKRRYRLFGKSEEACKLGMIDSDRIILTKNQYLDYTKRLYIPKLND